MKHGHKKSLHILKPFIGNRVVVETPIEPATGVLVNFEKSWHGGIGSLLLSNGQGRWVLVKTWISIKRRLKNEQETTMSAQVYKAQP